jgi:hypothetical protein
MGPEGTDRGVHGSICLRDIESYAEVIDLMLTGLGRVDVKEMNLSSFYPF